METKRNWAGTKKSAHGWTRGTLARESMAPVPESWQFWRLQSVLNRIPLRLGHAVSADGKCTVALAERLPAAKLHNDARWLGATGRNG